MGKWEMVRLGDVCEKITDGTHQTPQYCDAENGYLFLSSKNVTTEKIDWNDVKYIPESLHRSLYSRLAPRIGDILLAKNGTTGVAALVDKDCVFDIYVSLALLRPLSVVYAPYLLKAINSPLTKRQFNSCLKGIGVPNLHLTDIRNTEIPLPPIHIQQKIADALDQANTLIEKRKEQIEKLDLLIKSQFIKIFGDPMTNPMEFSIMELGKIAMLKSGKNVTAKDIHEPCNEYPYPCYGGNGIRGYIDKYSHDGSYPLIGRQGALCGNVQFAVDKFFPTEHAVVVSPIIEYRPKWLFYSLTYLELNRLQTGAAQPGLNIDILNRVPIPIPHLALQNEFAAFVERVEAQKSLLKQSLEKLELNYKSLMQKCFAGEIF